MSDETVTLGRMELEHMRDLLITLDRYWRAMDAGAAIIADEPTDTRSPLGLKVSDMLSRLRGILGEYGS